MSLWTTALATGLRYLDCSASLLFNKCFWAAVAFLVVAYLLRRVYRWFRPSPLMPVVDSPSASTATKPIQAAAAMARESARRVAEAIDAREDLPLKSYRLAIEANVLAQSARDVTDSVPQLSKELGVDMTEYLAYTANVLSDVEKKLTRRSSRR